MEKTETLNEVCYLNADKIQFKKIDVNKFIILFISTFGLYGIWWMYKSWQFFKDKDAMDIMPAMRALFCVFYLPSLNRYILELANEKGCHYTYSPITMYFGYLILILLGNLPQPYFLVAFLSFVFLLPPYKALNFAINSCSEVYVTSQKGFNIREIFLLIAGGILWLLGIVGLFVQA